MPIDLHSSVNSCSQWAFGSSALNSILGSSLFVAILISIVMMLLVMIFYPAKQGTGFGTVAKMGLYMFFTTLMIVFLHDSVLKYIFQDNTAVTSNDDLMRGLQQSGKNVVYGNEYVNVDPLKAAEPSKPQIVATGGYDSDDSDAGSEAGSEYAGGIVEDGGHGVLGGGRVPVRSGNPYSH